MPFAQSPTRTFGTRGTTAPARTSINISSTNTTSTDTTSTDTSTETPALREIEIPPPPSEIDGAALFGQQTEEQAPKIADAALSGVTKMGAALFGRMSLAQKIKLVAGLAMLAFFLANMLGSGSDTADLDRDAAVLGQVLHNLNSTSIKDAEREYQNADKTGGDADRCASAGKVASAYLKANDQSSYQKWKTREDQYCHR